MVKVNVAEEVLINSLKVFRDYANSNLESIIYGVELANNISASECTKKQCSELIAKLNNLRSLISNFRFGADPDPSGDGSFNLWCTLKLNDTPSGLYYYRDDFEGVSPVTEKTVLYVLMTLQREVFDQISFIETNYVFNSNTWFFDTLKFKLSEIVDTYIVS